MNAAVERVDFTIPGRMIISNPGNAVPFANLAGAEIVPLGRLFHQQAKQKQHVVF